MKKEKNIYLGGETDDQNAIMPQYFERFFDKKSVFLVFGMLALLLIISMFIY